MIILGILASMLAILFWQPSMSSNLEPSYYRKPTKLERYITNINKLLDQGHYNIVQDLLSRTKYSKEELPWNMWYEAINSKVSKIEKDAELLTDLKNLENMLKK